MRRSASRVNVGDQRRWPRELECHRALCGAVAVGINDVVEQFADVGQLRAHNLLGSTVLSQQQQVLRQRSQSGNLHPGVVDRVDQIGAAARRSHRGLQFGL